MKTAIVKTNNYGYRDFYCVEGTEVVFIESIAVKHEGCRSDHKIDSVFLESCVEGSVRVSSVVPSKPIVYGSKVFGDSFHISTTEECIIDATVMLVGIRKGFDGVRTRERNIEDFEANNSFWASVYDNNTGGTQCQKKHKE